MVQQLSFINASYSPNLLIELFILQPTWEEETMGRRKMDGAINATAEGLKYKRIYFLLCTLFVSFNNKLLIIKELKTRIRDDFGE